jgi:hypothetical protein
MQFDVYREASTDRQTVIYSSAQALVAVLNSIITFTILSLGFDKSSAKFTGFRERLQKYKILTAQEQCDICAINGSLEKLAMKINSTIADSCCCVRRRLKKHRKLVKLRKEYKQMCNQ